MNNALRSWGWRLFAVGGVLLVYLWLSPHGHEAPRRSPVQRLFGPVASLAASLQWVRMEAAIDAGERVRAHEIARLALELDPGSTEGWSYYARELVFQRASPTYETDPRERTRWVRLALDLLEEGSASAREPEELHHFQGQILGYLIDLEGAIPWPGGERALRLEAAEAYERAAALGKRGAGEQAEIVRRGHSERLHLPQHEHSR